MSFVQCGVQYWLFMEDQIPTVIGEHKVFDLL